MQREWPNFHDVDWEDLYPRLLLATKGRMNRLSWRGHKANSAPMGLQAHDFIQAAIDKALSGKRSYDHTRSLFENFMQVISSDISNAVLSYDNQFVGRADDKIVDIMDYRDGPEADAIYEQRVRKLFLFLGDRDLEAKRVAEQIVIFGRSSSIDLSVELQCSVKDIDNIKKRLGRLCGEFQRVLDLDASLKHRPETKRSEEDI